MPAWLRIPQLTLPILASLTPSEHEVVMVDEEVERLPVDEHWDVVGITAMTATAPRAYELTSFFRNNGAKVILGGIHPSVLPDEAKKFADAVVVGEAEGVWHRVLNDVERNRLKGFYNNSHPDVSQSPFPARRKRRTFLGMPYQVMPIMASRGCPNDCEFCCVHRAYGRKQRHLPIEHIVDDIRRTGQKRVMFLDDNIGGVRSYAMRLFSALKPLKVSWYGQASMRLILDDELFDAAVQSGLELLFVGVESLEPESRKKISKSLSSIEPYEKAVKRCRDAGVVFHASLIFGLDEETPHVFDRTLEFLIRHSVPSISACILTPYPGTRLFDRLMAEGRVLHTNWSYYDHTTVCFRPKNMEPDELAQKYLDFRNRFFSYSSILQRGYAQLHVAPLVYLGTNLAYRRTTRSLKGHFRTYAEWLREQKSSPLPEGIGATMDHRGT
jgi:radical SAM superfamily enzyme YgiQ (UPF0313 family)